MATNLVVVESPQCWLVTSLTGVWNNAQLCTLSRRWWHCSGRKLFFKRDDFLALASIFFRNLVRSSISSHSISPWPGRALAYVLFLEKQVPGKFLMPSSQTNTFNEHSRLFQESLIMRLKIQNTGLNYYK